MDNKFIINNIHTIGDCIAIPFFAIMIYYFNNKKYKTNFEKLLYLFSIVGLIADLLFIILSLCRYNSNTFFWYFNLLFLSIKK